MSITDELREWMGVVLTDDDPAHAIADRIDEEHERGMADAYLDGMPTDEKLAELGWVRLPMDADGEVIHIGDRMEDNERVVRVVLTDGSCEPSVYVAKLPNVLHERFCNEISHYHEPTIEDVLREFGDWYAHVKGGCDEDSIIAEYAAKLRLAGDADAGKPGKTVEA